MRSKEEIRLSRSLRAAISGMLLLLGLVSFILPGKVNTWSEFLCLPWFFTLCAAVICGLLPGVLLGLLIPAAACFLLHVLDPDPEGITALTVFFFSSLTAGIFCRRFKTGLGAGIAAVLVRLTVSALTGLVLGIFHDTSYTLTKFIEEEVLAVYGGLILPLVLLPLIVLMLRKSGLMKALWGEGRE